MKFDNLMSKCFRWLIWGFVLFVLLTNYIETDLITDIKECHKNVIISSQIKQITK